MLFTESIGYIYGRLLVPFHLLLLEGQSYAGPANETTKAPGNDNSQWRGRRISPCIGEKLLRAFVRHEIDSSADSVSHY